jgi:L-gulono-1,4-lactone dehydrogenase
MEELKPRHRIEAHRLLKTWWINIVNSASLLFTWGKRVRHEGRFEAGIWSDWSRSFSCRPAQFLTPATEQEICDIVKRATKVRVVGAGHSFNAGVLTDHTMISLDRFNKVSLRDHPQKSGCKIATAQAGVRLRDFTRILWEAGASVSVAGSTDAQSLGGLLGTDVHGTGRDHGFVSESILSLRIIDANGNVGVFRPGDDVFHAAIGGAGTCGIIIELEVECEPAYQLAKAIKVVDREWAENNIEGLLQENTHLSFYYFSGFARTPDGENVPGLNKVRMNKWNRTLDPPGKFRRAHKILDELGDMLFSGFLFDIARFVHLSDSLARLSLQIYALIVESREIVYPSSEGFTRTLYYRHDELEYGVPFENYRECLREIRRLLIGLKYPLIIEVRFTPDKRSQSLLGPGAGRRTAYLEITPSMSRPTDAMFRKVEQVLIRFGGKVHLGKKSQIERAQFESMHSASTLERFRAARGAQDPSGKFLNDFTGRLLG